MRQAAKFFVLVVGLMLMVASAAGQQFQVMEASIDEIHRGSSLALCYDDPHAWR